MSEDNVITIDGTNWDSEVINSDLPVLVDFWAEWCGPCKALAPTVHEVADELAGKLKVVKVNVDDNAAIASKFAIRSIPTLLLFKSGSVEEQLIGMMNKTALMEKIQPHV